MTHFNISVPATVIFDYPTVEALATHIATMMRVQGAAVDAPSFETGDAAAAWRAALAARLNGVICAVMGSTVDPEQPLMEVHLWLGFFCAH